MGIIAIFSNFVAQNRAHEISSDFTTLLIMAISWFSSFYKRRTRKIGYAARPYHQECLL